MIDYGFRLSSLGRIGRGLRFFSNRLFNADVIFGVDTLPGEGAAPVFLSDGVYGDFTVASGEISPNASLTAGTYDVGGVSVTVTSNARHVATAAELEAITDGTITPASGETVFLRPGSYAMSNDISSWNGHPSNVTFAAATPASKPILNRWNLNRTAVIENVTLRGLEITRAPILDIDKFWTFTNVSDVGLIQTGAQNTTLSGLVIEDCDFDGQMETAANGGVLFANVMSGDFSNAGISDLTVRRCTMRKMNSGILVGCDGFLIEDCLISQTHADGIVLQNAHGHCQDGLIRRNHFTDIGGNPSRLHSDFIQLQPSNNTFWQRRIQIQGNTATPGSAQPFAEVDNIGSTIETLTASQTLTITDHASELRLAPTGTMTLTLPSAAASEGLQFCLRRVNSAGTVAIAFNGSDTWEGGTPVLDSGEQGATFVSDGTSQWKRLPAGYLDWWIPRTASKTLGPQEENRVVMVDATAGNVVLTLPASGAGSYYVQRLDGSENVVSVTTSGGDSIALHGSLPGSVNFVQGQGLSVTRADDGDWTGVEATPTMQGIFGNAHPQGLYEDITIDGNILICMSPAGLKLEQEVAGLKVFNNTFLRPSYPDANEDGVIGRFEANSTSASGNIFLDGATARSWQNFTEGALSLSAGARDKGTTALSLSTKTPWSVPNTRAAVISAANPNNGARAYYDFSAGAVRSNLPAPTIVGSVPADGANYATTGAVEITFNQFITFGTGDVILRNVTDGTNEEVFDVAAGTGDNSGTVTILDDVLTITPGAALTDSKVYAVRMDAGAVVGHYGVGYPAISDDTTLNFTADASLANSFTRTELTGSGQLERVGALNSSIAYSHATLGFSGRLDDDARTFHTIMNIDQSRDFTFYVRSNGALYLGHATVGYAETPAAVIPFGVDLQILVAVDMTQATGELGWVIYVNGSLLDPATLTYTWEQNDFWVHTAANLRILGSPNAGREVNGAVDFFYYEPGVALDLSDSLVRSKFTAGEIGADGSGPSGSQPEIFMTGDSTSWNAGTNQGTLTGFSSIGTL